MKLNDFEKKSINLSHELKQFHVDLTRYLLMRDIKGIHSIYEENSGLINEILKHFDSLPALETNLYLNHLLQQISRYNALFQQVVIDQQASKNILELTELKPILHQKLHHLAPLKLVIEKKQLRNPNGEKYFRDHYTYGTSPKKYFYDEKKTKGHEAHQDETHYQIANAMIGSQTQVSNLFANFKMLGKKAVNFFNINGGQRRDHYFKKADEVSHQDELQKYQAFREKIIQGQEVNTFEGQYYRYPQLQLTPVEKSQYDITHIGHATEFITFFPEKNKPLFTILTDPVHYHTGTEGLVNYGGKLLYDRQTAPALTEYPGINVVLISHNHHDHMCPRTLKELHGASQTVYIVPAGDAAHMRKWGLQNVIEFESWNEYVEIKVYSSQENVSEYRIYSHPAKHASNRFVNDLYHSLYMGYLIHPKHLDECILVSGDTAVLDETHYEGLEKFLKDHQLRIGMACIAHGPDRPRKWMECTHQSSADAIVVHAKYQVMNVKNVLQTQNVDFDKSLLFKHASKAIAYHQGCFRLGLLSYHDVDATVMRTLALLHTLKDEKLKQNFYYLIMDEFERIAFKELLDVYGQKIFDKDPLSYVDIKKLIESSLILPMIGTQSTAESHFKFEYQKLIHNRNPGYPNASQVMGAYEDIIQILDHSKLKSCQQDFQSLLDTVKDILKFYTSRASRNKSAFYKKSETQAFLLNLNPKDVTELKEALTNHYLAVKGKLPDYSNAIRNEGHFQTAMLIIFGLIDFPESFIPKIENQCLQFQRP